MSDKNEVYFQRSQNQTDEDNTPFSRLPLQTARSLLQSYDKRTKQAEKKLADVEKQLEIQKDLARRYRDKYVESKRQLENDAQKTQEKSAEKNNGSKANENKENVDKNKQTAKDENSKKQEDKKGKQNDKSNAQNSSNKDNQKAAKNRPPSPEKNTKEKKEDVKHEEYNENKDQKENEGESVDKDLDDDRAIFKRHIVRIAESHAMKITPSPIRVVDVVRKSEILIEENEALSHEVQRLKFDNAELIKKSKHDEEERITAQRAFATSEAAREELERRLEKEIEKNKKLEDTLNKQTQRWIKAKQELQYMSHTYNQFVDSGGKPRPMTTGNQQMTDAYLSRKPNARRDGKRSQSVNKSNE